MATRAAVRNRRGLELGQYELSGVMSGGVWGLGSLAGGEGALGKYNLPQHSINVCFESGKCHTSNLQGFFSRRLMRRKYTRR